jgi:hypothetical protein
LEELCLAGGLLEVPPCALNAVGVGLMVGREVKNGTDRLAWQAPPKDLGSAQEEAFVPASGPALPGLPPEWPAGFPVLRQLALYNLPLGGTVPPEWTTGFAALENL